MNIKEFNDDPPSMHDFMTLSTGLVLYIFVPPFIILNLRQRVRTLSKKKIDDIEKLWLEDSVRVDGSG